MSRRPWFLLAAIAAAACGGYDAPDEVVLGALTYTKPAPGESFAGMKTYYLDPTMDVFQDGQAQVGKPVPASTAAAIQTNMSGYGWTQQTTPPVGNNNPNADVSLRLAYFSNTISYWYSGGYCSIYWAYYSCYPGWAYAGSYSTGTVVITMVDTRTSVNTKIAWIAGMYGVLTNYNDATKLNVAINTAFGQSPYLKVQ